MGNVSCAYRLSEPILKKKSVETTLYSISANPPERPDRRSGDRFVSLLRVGALQIGDRRELCLIRNISAGGMMIRPYSTIQPGTRLSVELKHGDMVSGVAQWSENTLVGVAFDEAIDVVALLSGTGEGPGPRMPRIELDCTALLRHDGDVQRVRVINISQGGICLKLASAPPVNSDVVVSITGLHSAAGVVKWEDGDFCGIGFNRVFPVNELMGFLQDQQQDERRRAAAG
jgi:hypothetical protein